MEWNMYTSVNVISFVLTYLLLCLSKELQFLLMSSMKNKTDRNLHYYFKTCTQYLQFTSGLSSYLGFN